VLISAWIKLTHIFLGGINQRAEIEIVSELNEWIDTYQVLRKKKECLLVSIFEEMITQACYSLLD